VRAAAPRFPIPAPASISPAAEPEPWSAPPTGRAPAHSDHQIRAKRRIKGPRRAKPRGGRLTFFRGSWRRFFFSRRDGPLRQMLGPDRLQLRSQNPPDLFAPAPANRRCRRTPADGSAKGRGRPPNLLPRRIVLPVGRRMRSPAEPVELHPSCGRSALPPPRPVTPGRPPGLHLPRTRRSISLLRQVARHRQISIRPLPPLAVVCTSTTQPSPRGFSVGDVPGVPSCQGRRGVAQVPFWRVRCRARPGTCR